MASFKILSYLASEAEENWKNLSQDLQAKIWTWNLQNIKKEC